VYDYLPGKVDWLAHGLPIEGERATIATVGSVARQDVVTCGLDDRVGGVRERIAASPYGFALVTAPGGVLLGRLRGSLLDCDPQLRAEEIMEAGPSTVRPDRTVEGTLSRLAERQLQFAIVTDPEGRLLGVASRAQLERASET